MIIVVFLCVLRSIILATLSRASSTAIIVSGNVFVFDPGGASSLRAHSVIGTI